MKKTEHPVAWGRPKYSESEMPDISHCQNEETALNNKREEEENRRITDSKNHQWGFWTV